MASTLTTFDALLKERYVDSSIVEKLQFPDNTLLGMLEKKGDSGMVGDTIPVPIITALPQGLGGVFSTAQSNVSSITAYKWACTAGDYFGAVHIGDKVLKAARTNMGAFLENKKLEIDGLYEQAADDMSVYAWGNGGGGLGTVSAIATNDITLTKPEQIANFEIGMTVVASANDGSTSSDTLKAGSTTVAGLNRSTGVVTLTSAAAITGTLAVGDTFFRQGDFNGDTGVVVLQGIQSYITSTATPGALYGVTAAQRATDPERLAGCRVASADLSGKGIEERIKILLARMTGRYKAKMPTAGFLHPEDFQTLETLMSARGQRSLSDESTQFGYAKIDVMAGRGRIPIYTDRHCPKGTFWALRMENWFMYSMGPSLFHPQNEDGFEMLRRATTTDYEFRLLSYPILVTNAPKNSGRVALS